MDDRNRLVRVADGLRDASANKEGYDGNAHEAVAGIFKSMPGSLGASVDWLGVTAWVVELSWMMHDYMRARPVPRPMKGEKLGLRFKTMIDKVEHDFPELQGRGITVTVEVDPELRPYILDLDKIGRSLSSVVSSAICDQVYKPRHLARYPHRQEIVSVTSTPTLFDEWPLPDGRED